MLTAEEARDMRLGMIVRADRRGLAYQTFEAWKALQPQVTVIIDMSLLDPKGRWVQDFTQYPGAIVTKWQGYTAPIIEDALQALASCDVVYTAETVYDPRVTKLVPVVRHINCELYSDEGESHPIYPTSWRLDGVPKGPTLPVPVPDERIAKQVAGDGLVLHPAGWQAALDRNGTGTVAGAIPRSTVQWRVASQYKTRVRPSEQVEFMDEVADRWDIYDGCSVMVMPRRYGGLCLPAQEAAARGLAVVMPDVSPNSDWPIKLLPISAKHVVRRRQRERLVVDVNPRLLAEVVSDQGWVTEFQEKALAWAQSLAWSNWKAEYRAVLERAADEGIRDAV